MAIKVGLFQVEKDAFGCFDSPTCNRPGADAEIVQLVFRLMNESYQVVDLHEEFNIAYDFGSRLPNGSWTGVTKLLIEKKIDMCGLSMRITDDRRQVLQFSYPTRYFKTVFVVRRPYSYCAKTFIFDVFSKTTWALLIATLIIVILYTFAVYYVLGDESLKRRKRAIISIKNTFRFPETKHRSLLVLNVVLLVMMFVMTSLYQSTIYSYLASAAEYHIPFYNLNQALDLVNSGQAFFTAFDTQTMLCSTDAVCKKFQKVTEKHPIKRRNTEVAVTADISQGGIYQSTVDNALLPVTVTWLERNNQDKIMIRDDDGITYYLGYAFHDKKLRDRFNQQLITVLPAIPNIVTGHGYDTAKQPFDLRYTPNASPLSFTVMEQLFRLFLIWIGFCVFALLTETVVYRFYYKFR